MEYDRCEQKIEFIGMKQVKELSLVKSIFPNDSPDYAIGFASADFIIWNLSTETKVFSFSYPSMFVDNFDLYTNLNFFITPFFVAKR